MTLSTPDLSLEGPVVSLLEKAESLRILPLCLGLVKSKGDICVLNVADYNLGDRYIMALAAGLKKARTLEKIYLSGNRITDISLADLASSIGQEVTVLELSRNKITILDKKILEMIIESQYRL
jgi:Leucine-rich repeat (LRR) protein